MNDTDHPSYPNPTIQEAICEIFFSLQEEADWNPIWYGEFFKQIQTEFPILEPVPFRGIQIAFGDPLPGNSIPPISPVVRYRHKSRPLLLQLSENRIIVNLLPTYPGWKIVAQDITYAWEKLGEVVRPQKVGRIGLRYINRIERTLPDETLGNWLVATDYVPRGILSSLPGLGSHVQSRQDEHNRINVTIGESEDPATTQRAFIFDIDRILEREISIDTSQILAEVGRLHQDVWDVFRAAKGEQLEKLLRGELL